MGTRPSLRVSTAGSGGNASSDSDEYNTDEYNTDDELQPTPSKIKKKGKGAATVKTKFNNDWQTKWPFVHEVRGDA